MKPAEELRFRQLVLGRSEALLRSAYLLVGDRGRAEDLVQTALAKTYAAWPRIRDAGALEAYVRRVMVTTATSWWRGLRFREHPVAEAPARPVPDAADAVAERDAMWRQLAALPVKQRAVLVLRYYEGLSEAEIAEVLEVSRGTVKSHTSRAMSALRRRMTEPCPEVAA
ncbi:RNA polymerase sigma factor [Pilimelia terevasa]|uniref:RNA polymerase sigma factor n=1 Tax=Pilimelia terevasa TaxID=53372 RepID=A0A8J3BIA9_9ACTN|nr:SigE family RNA polymerase sigma factor [Pilimelia terevasa]GGK21609.1 RNA polymerase sigma factor [Pilimelia terevasa]